MFHEVRDEGNGLDGFPQAHLVRQDPIQIIVVERNQPLQAFDLTDKEGTPRRHQDGVAPRRAVKENPEARRGQARNAEEAEWCLLT